jgi:hypothetical protein
VTWNIIRNPKMPTTDDVAKHTVSEWQALEVLARQRLRQAKNSRARQRQMERIDFCRVAAGDRVVMDMRGRS